MIIALPDGPGVRGRPLRHLQDRRRRGDGQPAAQGRGHRLLLRVHAGPRGRGATRTLEALRRPRRGCPLAEAPARGGRRAEGHASFEAERSRAPTRFENVADASRRRRDLALLRRHHGQAQGGRPDPPPRSRTPPSSTPRASLGYARGRRHALRAEALLRLRHRLQPVLPVRGRRHAVLFPEHPHAGVALRADPAPPADHPHQRADHGEPDGRAPGRRASRTSRCLRFATSAGEALPRRALPALEGDLRRRAARRPGHGRDVAHLHHQPAGRRAARARSAAWSPASTCGSATTTGASCRAGEVGRLWVRGGSRAIGYWQQMEQDGGAASAASGTCPGDLVGDDADGYVTYCGRADEMLKVAGQVARAPGGRGLPAAAPGGQGVRGGGRRRRRAAWSSPTRSWSRASRAPGLDEELKAFVRERLEPYKYPREVVFVDALPRTHLGKVDRGKLRRG